MTLYSPFKPGRWRKLPSSAASLGADLAAAGAGSGAAGADRPNQFDFGRGALARRSS